MASVRSTNVNHTRNGPQLERIAACTVHAPTRSPTHTADLIAVQAFALHSRKAERGYYMTSTRTDRRRADTGRERCGRRRVNESCEVEQLLASPRKLGSGLGEADMAGPGNSSRFKLRLPVKGFSGEDWEHLFYRFQFIAISQLSAESKALQCESGRPSLPEVGYFVLRLATAFVRSSYLSLRSKGSLLARFEELKHWHIL
eukprot:3485874-Pleurochrysis_carterae.AAC.5